MTGPQVTLALHVSAPNLPINQVEALLPAAGVRLPSGSSLQGGTLTANLAITGPANAPTISGPVQVDNTTLAGFDLSSKIGGLKPVSGSKGGTQIQTVRANVNSSPQGTRIDNLYASVPVLGTATGAGTVSPQGALNFQVVAKLNTSSGVACQALSRSECSGGRRRGSGSQYGSCQRNPRAHHRYHVESRDSGRSQPAAAKECGQYYQAADPGQRQ